MLNIYSSNGILEVVRACKKHNVPNCRRNNFSFISPFFPKKIKLEFNFKIWDFASIGVHAELPFMHVYSFSGDYVNRFLLFLLYSAGSIFFSFVLYLEVSML